MKTIFASLLVMAISVQVGFAQKKDSPTKREIKTGKEIKAEKESQEIADKIVLNFIKATGGVKKWTNITTLKTDLKVHVGGGAISFDGRYFASIPLEKLRVDISILGKWHSQVSSSKGIEGKILGLVDVFTKESVRPAKETIVPLFVEAKKNKKNKMTFVGEKKIDDEEVNQVKLDYFDGRTYDYYFDKKTFFLVEDEEHKQKMVTKTKYSDYFLTSYGLSIARKKVVYENGSHKITFENLNTLYNEPLTDQDFVIQ